MKERLLQFLNTYQITSTRLADRIGVQRSSISHILSGRNKPSYDFIYKLLEHYPEINPRWLILGAGAMYIKEQQASIPFDQEKPASSSRESDIKKTEAPQDTIKESQEDEPPVERQDVPIERIVIFFSDHSFEEYHPGGKKS
jgi:transcriptional regulator with XRE-family HTH domain